jgi:hypothetical protein
MGQLRNDRSSSCLVKILLLSGMPHQKPNSSLDLWRLVHPYELYTHWDLLQNDCLVQVMQVLLRLNCDFSTVTTSEAYLPPVLFTVTVSVTKPSLN